MIQPQIVRKSLVLIGASVLGFLALAITAQEQPNPPRLPAKDFKDAKAYEVVRIDSAESIVLKMEGKDVKVRLLGVDSPANAEAKREAERVLRNLLVGESVFVEFAPGMTDCYVFRAPEGLFVNLELVRQGHALPNEKMAGEYGKACQFYEKEARKSQRGCWAPPGQNMVCIGKGSLSYHRETCMHLAKTKIPIPISLATAVGNDYQPCKHCKP